MPLMSRFRKEKSEEDEDVLEEGEEEGLLMTTAPQQGRPEEGEDEELLTVVTSQQDAPEDEAGTQEATGALDSPTAGEEAPAEPGSAEGDSASQPESQGGAADDPLAMLRETATEGLTSGLANEIEDVPVEELLTELQEVRSLLPGVDTGAE